VLHLRGELPRRRDVPRQLRRYGLRPERQIAPIGPARERRRARLVVDQERAPDRAATRHTLPVTVERDGAERSLRRAVCVTAALIRGRRAGELEVEAAERGIPAGALLPRAAVRRGLAAGGHTHASRIPAHADEACAAVRVGRARVDALARDLSRVAAQLPVWAHPAAGVLVRPALRALERSAPGELTAVALVEAGVLPVDQDGHGVLAARAGRPARAGPLASGVGRPVPSPPLPPSPSVTMTSEPQPRTGVTPSESSRVLA
jgi:hypothetical protein